MNNIWFLFFLSFIYTLTSLGQNVLFVLDRVNEANTINIASFSYDIKVENVKGADTVLLDSGMLIVNNTQGKFDDFMYISHQQKDTFSFVKDTLLRLKLGEIRKDYTPGALHNRLGTTQMFFRCFSSSFRNEVNIINVSRWDSLSLDSTDAQYYYLSLRDTMMEYDVVQKRTAHIMVDKNNFQIRKYNYKSESRGSLLNNVFTFSNWTSSSKVDDDVQIVFEKIRQRSNSPEYLLKFPSKKMLIDQNKGLSLDEVSIIDSSDVNYKLGEIKKRYLVLYFWFQGCVHCKHVGPVIEKFHKSNTRKDIVYIGVDTMSKNKRALLESIEKQHYNFPNYRYNEGVKDLTVNGAPMVIVYDNFQNKVLEQLLGGSPDYESKFAKVIQSLPAE
jgi:thiol-disulfide isomerase/thioredoxin